MDITVNTEQRRPHIVFVLTSDASIGFLRGQLRYLRNAGLDVTVISNPGPSQQIATEQGARVISVPMEREISLWRDIRSLFELFCALRGLKPDLVVNGTPKAGLLGGIAALLARVPHRIYILHGLRMETASGWKREVLRVAETIAGRCAHQVVAISPSLRARAIQLGVVEAKHITVWGNGTSNGLDSKRFESTPERREQALALRRTLGIDEHALVVGFVGRLTRDKGIRELYDAFVHFRIRFPEARLLLVGDFEDGDSVGPALKKELQSDAQITITGFVADTAPYYWAMDVLGFPTYREGFGNVSLEAQAAGVPVVTTNATGAIDSVKDGQTGIIVSVGDSAALAAAISSLLADPILRQEMGSTGAAWVREMFSAQMVWQEHTRQFRAAMIECQPRLNSEPGDECP